MNEPFDRVSRTGGRLDVSHYTQMIWHRTTKVGCAHGTGERPTYLVCR